MNLFQGLSNLLISMCFAQKKSVITRKVREPDLSEQDKKIYDRFQENCLIEKSVNHTAKQEKAVKISKKAIEEEFNNKVIAKLTGLTIEHIEQLRNEA